MAKITNKYLQNYCLKHKKTLTPSRRLIIKTLSKYSRPKSAYELQKDINKKSDSYINISTIYRVLEFWIKIGFVHKISSINKFLLCLKPEQKHTHMLNYCTVCEKVIETCNKTMNLDFKNSTAKLDLAFNNTHSIEIPVICSNCS